MSLLLFVLSGHSLSNCQVRTYLVLLPASMRCKFFWLLWSDSCLACVVLVRWYTNSSCQFFVNVTRVLLRLSAQDVHYVHPHGFALIVVSCPLEKEQLSGLVRRIVLKCPTFSVSVMLKSKVYYSRAALSCLGFA